MSQVLLPNNNTEGVGSGLRREEIGPHEKWGQSHLARERQHLPTTASSSWGAPSLEVMSPHQSHWAGLGGKLGDISTEPQPANSVSQDGAHGWGDGLLPSGHPGNVYTLICQTRPGSRGQMICPTSVGGSDPTHSFVLSLPPQLAA